MARRCDHAAAPASRARKPGNPGLLDTRVDKLVRDRPISPQIWTLHPGFSEERPGSHAIGGPIRRLARPALIGWQTRLSAWDLNGCHRILSVKWDLGRPKRDQRLSA
jgi:hypothetical protein